MGEGIEKGVGCRVVSLARRSQHGYRRGEQHEEVELIVQGRGMEVPRPCHLGRQDLRHARRVEVHERRVLQDARGVHDAAELRHASADLLEDASQLRLRRDIRGQNRDLRAHPPHPLHRRECRLRRRAPAEQH